MIWYFLKKRNPEGAEPTNINFCVVIPIPPLIKFSFISKYRLCLSLKLKYLVMFASRSKYSIEYRIQLNSIQFLPIIQSSNAMLTHSAPLLSWESIFSFCVLCVRFQDLYRLKRRRKRREESINALNIKITLAENRITSSIPFHFHFLLLIAWLWLWLGESSLELDLD